MLEVTAYIGGDKQDPSASAQFANLWRAEQYAQLLADSGDYTAVFVKYGQEMHVIAPKK